MKDILNYLMLVIIMMIVASMITYYFTKKKYENNFIPKPIILTIRQTTPISPIVGRGKIQVANLPVVNSGNITDSIKENQTITFASIDTAVQYESKIKIKDTTIVSNDTLYLQVKYYFPPENKFVIIPIIKNKNYIYTEFKPVFIEKPKTILDKIGIVIGIGYGTRLDKIQLAPTIFLGIAYKLDIKF